MLLEGHEDTSDSWQDPPFTCILGDCVCVYMCLRVCVSCMIFMSTHAFLVKCVSRICPDHWTLSFLLPTFHCFTSGVGSRSLELWRWLCLSLSCIHCLACPLHSTHFLVSIGWYLKWIQRPEGYLALVMTAEGGRYLAVSNSYFFHISWKSSQIKLTYKDQYARTI